MANRDPNQLYDLINSMCEHLKSAIEEGEKLADISKQYKGLIEKVLIEQMNKFFIPSIKKMIEDKATPGSMRAISEFLDCLPMSIVRTTSVVDEIAPIAVDETKLNAVAPASSAAAVDEIPSRASFANPAGINNASNIPAEEPIVENPAAEIEEVPADMEAGADVEAPAEMEAPVEQEPKAVGMPESVKKSGRITEANKDTAAPVVYRVVRSVKPLRTLGGVDSRIKEQVVDECDTECKAQKKCDMLNKTVSPAELAAFGTHFKVVPYECLH